MHSGRPFAGRGEPAAIAASYAAVCANALAASARRSSSDTPSASNA